MKKLGRRFGIFVAGILLVVAGAIALWRIGSRAPNTARTPAVAPATETPSWSLGARRVYAVRLSSRVTMDKQSLFDVNVRGKLRAVRIGGSKLDLALELEVEKATLSDATAETDAVARALAEPFGVTFSAQGVVETIAFPPARAPEPARAAARGLLRTIASALQVSSPPSSNTPEWTAQERDPVGSVKIRYAWIDARQLSKTKLAYTHVSSSDASVDARTELAASSGELTLARDHVSPAALERVRLKESTRVQSEGPLPKLTSELELELDWIASDVANGAEVSMLASTLESAVRSALDDRRLENQMTLDHAKLRGSSFPQLLQDLRALPNGDARARAHLFSLLKTHLRFEEQSVLEAERLIRTGAADKATLIDALGSAGSARAQGVLQGIVREASFSGDDRRRALIALSFVERPSRETLDLLEDLRNDETYGVQALYGLGTAAYNLRTSDPGTSRGLTAEITRELGKTDDPNQQVTLIKAIGNAGHADALDVLEQKLKDPQPAVRAAAVWALRRVPGERADQGIAVAIVQDEAALVRLRALEALSYRTASPVLVYALRQGLLAEQDVAVRRDLVRAALRWQSVAPLLTPVLNQLAASDPDDKIRELLGKT